MLPGYLNVAGIVLVFFTIGESCVAETISIIFFVAYGFSGSAGIQKKRENLTVARPTVRGLRIAHQCRTSNAEASRGI